MTATEIKTSHGIFIATFSERGLAQLDFPRSRNLRRSNGNDVSKPKNLRAWQTATAEALKQSLAGRTPKALPPLDLTSGQEFQRRVWSALQTISTGKTRSYSEVAATIGKPKAARAVGSACGANPIPVLIPCHRVLAANKKIGGFSGGLDWKRALLEREGISLA